MGRAKRLRVEKLPQKLKQIRESLKLSQNELIRKLGFENEIYQGNISEYESGKREPPLPIILKYSRLARISLETLIDDDLEIESQNIND